MKHDWYSGAAGGLLGTLWTTGPMNVVLLKPGFVPNPDTQKVYADIAAQEVAAGGGYALGGLALTNCLAVFDPASEHTNYLADDSTWTGVTFDVAFAVLYLNVGAKPLWSLVDLEGTEVVSNGVYLIDWATSGLLFSVPI